MPASQEMAPGERLILALDVPSAAEARDWVRRLGDTVRFYKVGLELFAAGEAIDLVDWLRERGKLVFADLKLFDVPNTVARAVARLRDRGVRFVTVHGNDAMIAAACQEKGPETKILAVTVLTSLDQADMEDLGFRVEIEPLAVSRARRAVELGCDGVVASGREAPAIRAAIGNAGWIVVPGVRPDPDARRDDQKRIVGLQEAFERGADYVVIGRPIREAPDPVAETRRIQERIEAWFREHGAGGAASPD